MYRDRGSAACRALVGGLLAAAALAVASAPASAEVLFTDHAALGTAITRLANGEFLIGGDADAGGSFAAMRIRADGRIDTGFGNRGFTQVTIGTSGFNDLSGLLVLPDGRILLSGTVGTEGSQQNGAGTTFGVARLSRGGRLDRSFGQGGHIRFTAFPKNPSDKSEWIAQMPDGRVMTGGDGQPDLSSSLEPCVFSFNLAFAPTPGFSPLCHAIPGASADYSDAAPGPGGTTLLALHATTDSQHLVLGLTRIGATGRPDPGFGSGGASAVDFGAMRGGLNQIGVTRLRSRYGGGWLVAGTGPDGFSFAGFRADGTLDPSFGSAGRLALHIAGTFTRNDVLVDLVRLDGGRRFLAVGQTELQHRTDEIDLELVRLNADGTLDRGFGHSGRLVLRPQDLGVTNIAQIDAAADAGHERVVVVGASHAQRYGALVVRIDGRGRVDRSFGS